MKVTLKKLLAGKNNTGKIKASNTKGGLESARKIIIDKIVIFINIFFDFLALNKNIK